MHKHRLRACFAVGTTAFFLMSVSRYSSHAQQMPKAPRDSCEIGVEALELVGSGSDRFARVKIRSQTCERLCRVLLHVAVMNVTGTLDPSWPEGNGRYVPVPKANKYSDWAYIPLETTGGGTLRITAILTSCDDQDCEYVGIRVDPQSIHSPVYSIP